ncbi:MAG: hypothetical protein WCR42_15235 [bacterium]
MKKLILIGLFICISYAANAQVSTYLEKGQTGIGLQAFAEKGYKLEGYGAKLCGTMKGIVDIEVIAAHDIYDKDINHLISGNTAQFYNAKATWWLYRSTIVSGIEANVGISGGFMTATYKDFKFNNTETNQPEEYTSFAEGTFGLETSINIQLSKTWFFQPQYSVYAEAGNDEGIRNNKAYTESYTGLTTNIGAAIFKRIPNCGTAYFDIDQFSDTFDSDCLYYISLGYIHSF